MRWRRGAEFGTAIRAAAWARWHVAVRTTVSLVLALGIGVALGHPAWGAIASIGAFAGFYAPETPYRYRARLVATIGAALVVAMLAGSLAAPHAWAGILVAGVIAALASFGCLVAAVPPPREYLIVLAVLVATGLPPVGVAMAFQRAGFVAVGAALGWAVTMAPALVRPQVPQRRVVAAALRAIARLLETDVRPGVAGGPDDAAGAQHAAVAAVARARSAVGQSGLGPSSAVVQSAVAAEHLLLVTLHVRTEATRPLAPGWADAVRAVAQVVQDGDTAGPDPPTDAAAGDAAFADAAFTGADALRSAIAQIRRAGRGRLVLEPADLPRPAPFWAAVRRLARWRSVVVPSALRMGVGVTAGAGVGRLLGLSHSYWVGLSAAAVLIGTNAAVALRRSLHRVAGTVVGVALAYAVLVGHPPVVAVILVVALCQFTVEIVITTSYGVAVAFITVMSLVVFSLSAPGADITTAVDARLLDTAIGAALAIGLRLLLWPRASAARLPAAQASAVRGVIRVLRDEPAGTAGAVADLVSARRELQAALLALRAVQADVIADQIARSGPRWAGTVAIERLAVLALAAPEDWAPPPPSSLRAFTAGLDALATALEHAARPATASALVLAGYPRTTAAAQELAEAVADLGATG